MNAKKPKNLQPTPAKKRTLDDFPHYAEAIETLRRLHVEQRKIAEESRQAEGSRATPQESRISNLAATLLAKATGKPSPTASNDPTELAEKMRAIQNAIQMQSQKIQGIKNELSTELYKDWEAEHFAARVEIADCVVRLKKAVDDELAMGHQMFAQGALTNPTSRLLVNFSSCGPLLQTIRGMSLNAFIETNSNLLD